MTAVLSQIENALPQLIASVIIAALTAGVGRIVNMLRGGNKPAAALAATPAAVPPSYPTPQAYPAATPPYPAYPTYPTPPAYPTAPARLNWGQALLHIGVLQLTVNVVGVIVGVAVRLSTSSQQEFLAAFIPTQLLLGTLAMIAFFVFFGLRVQRAPLWRHLTVVALGTVILTLLVNSAFAGVAEFLNPGAIIFALIQTFLAMGIGGGIVALTRPKAAAAPVAPPLAYAPTQPPYYPPAPQRYIPPTPPPNQVPNQAPWPGSAMPPAPPAGGAAPPPYSPGYPPPAPPRQP